ncbi:MAG TPA: fumarylacetoacetate hydrolase family protein [Burkholderiaceae bacterium]|jgi:fumarylpyruvate hydrolase|nr:fumarylacetoacetate hydrolase family protein [Burkholderiaceae bacterium]
MNFPFPPPPQPFVPISDSADAFPVHRIYCVGRNYEDHAREMGASGREAPFFFCKPADAVLYAGSAPIVIPYPDRTADLQHEVELVVAIGSPGYRVTVEQAARMIWGGAVGIDLTRRDLQAEAKRLGRPWEVGKAFERSAPVGAIRPAADLGSLGKRRIWLSVNGTIRQDGDLSRMIWSVEETISQLSGLFELAAGDLIFTGTPAGVGPLVPGDRIEAGIDGIGIIQARIGDRT